MPLSRQKTEVMEIYCMKNHMVKNAGKILRIVKTNCFILSYSTDKLNTKMNFCLFCLEFD